MFTQRKQVRRTRRWPWPLACFAGMAMLVTGLNLTLAPEPVQALTSMSAAQDVTASAWAALSEIARKKRQGLQTAQAKPEEKREQDQTEAKQENADAKKEGGDSPKGTEAKQENKNECGRGLYLSNGNCCPRGTRWNGKRCLRQASLQPDCPGGNCRTAQPQTCPTGTTGRYPNCRTTQVCPSGMVGAPPNCQFIRGSRAARSGSSVCPPGTAGVPPICRRLSRRPCPAGTVPSAGRCIVLQGQRGVRRPNLNLSAPRPAQPTPRVGSGSTARPLWR
jgi:hypothetical protein